MLDGRHWIRSLVFPVFLFGGLGAAAILHARGFNDLITVGAPVFLVSMGLLVLQRLTPFTEDWRGTRADFGLDLLHMLTTSTVGEVWRALVFGVAVKASLVLAAFVGTSLWPTSLPWVVQFGLALLIGDLGAYWAHRGCHTFPLLWRIHAMHHSSERLYVFAASRSHPLNFVLAWGSAAVPLLLLGCPPSILLLVGAFTALHGMLQHANVDMAHGVFNLLFSTADLHRWHHSASFVESNTNFGSNLILWDRVFGTFYLPADRRRPERLGLEGVAIPENLWAHLASPVLLGRWTDELPEEDDFTLESPVDVRGKAPRAATTPTVRGPERSSSRSSSPLLP